MRLDAVRKYAPMPAVAALADGGVSSTVFTYLDGVCRDLPDIRRSVLGTSAQLHCEQYIFFLMEHSRAEVNTTPAMSAHQMCQHPRSLCCMGLCYYMPSRPSAC